MIKDAIGRIISGEHLSETEAELLMEHIMSGCATDAQIASFITALSIKGETVDEITGFARVMRKKAVNIRPNRFPLVDTCGTGGDETQTFNISTTVALVIAGAGAAVAKHGNRSVSSKCGSADVLEALGVNINLGSEQVSRCIDEVGIGFIFAPAFHQAMKYAVNPRREIGIRTVFNILGPLTNPAGANRQLLGVYKPELTEVTAGVLAKLGSTSAFVVHGAGGLDEVSILGPTKVSEVRNGKVSTGILDPAAYGFEYAPLEHIKGGTAKENAEIIINILKGEKGPKRDIVILNAALGLKVSGITEDVANGVEIASGAIDSGAALSKLNELIEFTNSFIETEEKVS